MGYWIQRMATEANPYELLGVSRDASPEEVRQAYRRAALEWHPDNRPAQRAEATRRFRELTQAYEVLWRRQHRQALHARATGHHRAYTPQDFFHLKMAWRRPAEQDDGPEVSMRWRDRQVMEKLTYATVNETRVFVCFWILAVMLSMLVAGWLGSSTTLAPAMHGPGALGMLAMAAPLGTYAVVVALTLVALVLTRRIVWRIVEWGMGWRRALPSPQGDNKLPRNARSR